MFSKSITSSSSFLMMPATSRLLYYDFGMSADDDGYVEHFTIMRMTEAKPDDLKVLEARGFVKVFDDKVLIISDWKENNYIQKDRYTPSKYLDVYKMDTQVRLELGKSKDRLGENTELPQVRKIKTDANGDEIPEKKNTARATLKGFPQFQGLYPKKADWERASAAWKLLSEADRTLVLEDLPKRVLGKDWTKDEGKYIPLAKTYLEGRRWEDEIREDKGAPLKDKYKKYA